MKRYRLILFMIICSLLTACGQTISASETVIDGETASVISEIVSEKEVLPNSDKDAETVTAGLPSIRESYSDWQEAYLDYMDYLIWIDCKEIAENRGKNAEEVYIQYPKEDFGFDLIYVDDNTIPELFVTTKSFVGGCWIVTFFNGQAEYNRFDDESVWYSPRSGYVSSCDKISETITKLENGTFEVVFNEEISDDNNAKMSQYIETDRRLSPEWGSYNDIQRRLNDSLSIDINVNEGCTDWACAYLGYIKSIPATWYSEWEEKAVDWFYTSSFSLIYLDDDDIPELYISSNTIPFGEVVATFSEGRVEAWHLRRDASYYIPREGYIEENIREGVYISRLENGHFVVKAYGTRYEHFDEDEKEYDWYDWMDESVTREEFYSNMAKHYDKEKLVYLHEQTYPLWEMVSILSTGHTTSENHRYQAVLADVTWEEAFDLAKADGGYLAVITSDEEYEVIAEVIKAQMLPSNIFYVAGQDYMNYSIKWIFPDGREEIGYKPDKHYYWDEWDDDWNSFKKGHDDWYNRWGKDYSDVCEYGVLKYNKELSSVYLNFAPSDVLQYVPDYSGKIGYIVEYDE